MFGMLDYRAHKLYALLVYPVIFLISVIRNIIMPFIAVLAACSTSNSLFWQVILSLAYWCIASILMFFIKGFLLWIPVRLFDFLVDIIPSHGRTKEEARAVVEGGRRAEILLRFNKPAAEWTNSEINELGQLDFYSRFFSKKIKQRMYRLKYYYQDHPDIQQTYQESNIFLNKNNLDIKLPETIITNPFFRNLCIQLVMLMLFFYLINYSYFR